MPRKAVIALQRGALLSWVSSVLSFAGLEMLRPGSCSPHSEDTEGHPELARTDIKRKWSFRFTEILTRIYRNTAAKKMPSQKASPTRGTRIIHLIHFLSPKQVGLSFYQIIQVHWVYHSLHGIILLGHLFPDAWETSTLL